MRYGVAAGGGGGGLWGVWAGGDCFNDDCTYETLWGQMSLTHNDGENINVCILK